MMSPFATESSGNFPESDTPSENIAELSINERTFGIRAADIDERRNSASMLINKMYAWRGYGSDHQVNHEPNKITLTASDKGEVIGTLSLGLDSSVGLLADQVFKDCIDPFRAQGKVCEIIKLAVDPAVKSKTLLASLFHVALIYCRDLHGCTDIIIEVNPRHRRFYEAMLGFDVLCEARPNPRVDAPAVLLRLPTAWPTAQIEQLAANGGKTGSDRSLYGQFYSLREEAGIRERLKKIG